MPRPKKDPVTISEITQDSKELHARIEAFKVHWDGKSVIVALPVYRSLNPNTHFTLMMNYAQYGVEKLGVIMKDRTVIHECRNELIHIAKQIPGAKTVLMFDDDMLLPPGNEGIVNGLFELGLPKEQAMMSTISRLMSHPYGSGVIGGLYYGRHKWGMPQCDWGFNENRGNLANALRAGQFSGLQKMPWVGTGAIRIDLSDIEILEKEIDAGKFPGCEPKPGRWYGYFTPFSSAVGEDVSFCRRMTESGVSVSLDASLVLGHFDGATCFGPKNTANKTT